MMTRKEADNRRRLASRQTNVVFFSKTEFIVINTASCSFESETAKVKYFGIYDTENPHHNTCSCPSFHYGYTTAAAAVASGIEPKDSGTFSCKHLIRAAIMKEISEDTS